MSINRAILRPRDCPTIQFYDQPTPTDVGIGFEQRYAPCRVVPMVLKRAFCSSLRPS